MEEEIRKSTVFFTPEGVLMLSLAIILDIAGIIFTFFDLLAGLGEIPSWISDGLGIVIFGLWILIRSRTITKPAEIAKKVVEKRRAIKGVGKGMARGLRFGLATIGETVPVVGVLPFWTWLVWSELKS